MKKNLLLLVFFLSPAALLAQQQYNISLDLKNIKNDQVKVVIETPEIKEATARYVIPSVIPGSYSRKDYGRFITGFKAYDKKGRKLKTSKNGENLFVISDASKLHRLEYFVNDTWDVPKNDNYIFQPGGTNIEAGKNVVLNHFGFYGYLDNYKMLPYTITVDKPEGFYAATSLAATRSATRDVLQAPDYVKLADAPVLYCRPDTASFMSGNARIGVAVYSETGMVTAGQIAGMLQPLSQALLKFFVTMPVERYEFLMYFPSLSNTTLTTFGGFGALEHSYSSFYFLPEQSGEALESMVLGVAAHEFLHILTPLNIHSEEIGYFDFKDPKMSQHLWLYEGVTEYFSNLVQVRDNLMSYQDFVEETNNKIRQAAAYPEVSFTEKSRRILEPEYEPMYQNVYYKGALIGFLLDIRLMELSNGTKGLREVMLELSRKYGPDKPFKDDALIDEIVAISFPEIRQFFDKHVIGAEPLPYREYFRKIGWEYSESKDTVITSFGKLGQLAFDEKKGTFLISEGHPAQNAFGLKTGDVLAAINGIPLSLENFEQLFQYLMAPQPDKQLTVSIRRGKENLDLKATPKQFKAAMQHVLEPDEQAPAEQVTLRNKMLNRQS